MLKEILESVLREDADPVKQIILSTDIAYSDFMDELYKETRISKKELVKIIMNGEDTDLDVDFNDVLAKVCDKTAKKLAQGFKKNIDDVRKTRVEGWFDNAEQLIKDEIKKEVLAELRDLVLNNYL